MIQREIVEKKKWTTNEEVMDYYAVGQCTPGIIAVNTATFIGYKNKGILGALAATFGIICPSLFIISIIATFLTNFADLEIVKYAFSGIRICVCVLILQAVFNLSKSSIIDKASFFIFFLLFLLSVCFQLSPILSVVIAGVLGCFIQYIRGGKKWFI